MYILIVVVAVVVVVDSPIWLFREAVCIGVCVFFSYGVVGTTDVRGVYIGVGWVRKVGFLK